MRKINIELDAMDAYNIMALMQVVMQQPLHPKAVETINRYFAEVKSRLTYEIHEEIDAEVETDIMLADLGFSYDYNPAGKLQLFAQVSQQEQHPDNDIDQINHTEFYDTKRFRNKLQARQAAEIYLVKYAYPVMYVIDPDGAVTELRMMYNNIFGLDVDDTDTLMSFLDKDMEKRAKA